LQNSCSVLGNIQIGEGAIITAKSIVTKSVPAFARVSGVPGKVKSFIENSSSSSLSSAEKEDDEESVRASGLYGRQVFEDVEELSDFEVGMVQKYLRHWKVNETILD